MNKNNAKKMFAMAAVAMMMLSGAFVLAESDQSDATDGVLESLYPGSWTWDTATGIGPFNSFYAAFDMTDGNKFYAILNPYNLKETISGETLSPLSNYNIMWVLPTVYWKAVGNDVTITNDSTSGGTAYAHTIDGKVYNYIAYGVYHGAKKTVGGVDVLTSESGVSPTASQTRATFRDQANNYVMDSSLGTDAHSMLWNFYQWTLYKLCCYTVMEDFNSQATVGNGNVYGGNHTKLSGSLDTYGPYAGNNGDLGSSGSGATTYGQDAAKLFIEEAWGTVRDFVDGVVVDGTQGFYIDTSSTPTDSSTAGGNVEYVAQALPSSGWQSAISNNEKVWGIGTAASGAWNTGLADYFSTSTSNNHVLCVGGNSNTAASNSVNFGLSYASAFNDTSGSDTHMGSRLAFVFDAGPASTVNAPYTYTLEYDPTLMSTTSAAISVAGMNPISHDAPPTYTATIEPNESSYGSVSSASITDIEPGTVITTSSNTLTIGSTTITATPTTSTAQYTYAFDGWYIGDDPIVSGTTTVDADVTITANFTRTLNEYTVSIAKNNNAWGSVSQASVTVPYGTSISTSGSTLTIGSTTITATPTTSTAQYTYAFGSWTGASGTVTGDKNITANFTQTLNTYTVTISKNNNSWGTVSQSTVTNVPYGTTVSASGSTLTVGSTNVTATPTTSDAQYTYGFNNWTNASGTVTGNKTITANFTQTVNEYTVTIQPNEPSYGSVSTSSLTVPYGTSVSVSEGRLTVGSTHVFPTPTTSDAQYTYAFANWTNATGTITADRTITANFTRTVNEYTVTVESNNTSYGTVSQASVTVPYGTAITVSGNSLTIGSTDITASIIEDSTGQYTRYFDGFYIGNDEITTSVTVDAAKSITARFHQAMNAYDIAIIAGEGGSISPVSELTNVAWGTSISADGAVLTIGSATITAVPNSPTSEYSYVFDSWTGIPVSGTVTTDLSISASFTQTERVYTITWSILGVTSTETYHYGDTPVHADPEFTGYTFGGWNPSITTVTDDVTYTAILTPIVYTVTWDANGGNVDPTSSTGSIEQEIALPTPTRAWYTFDGWFTESEGGTQITSPFYPTENATYHAHWSPLEYTITLDGNGGTPESSTVTGSPVTSATLPSATNADRHLVGWFTEASEGTLVGFPGTMVYPSENVTYHAIWSDDAVYTYNVNFNLNGGYNGPSALAATSSTDVSQTLTIPEASPTKDGLVFGGWATSPNGNAIYHSGDSITVDADESITLYAVYSNTAPIDWSWLKTAIPVFVGVGLLVGVVSMFVTGKMDVKDLPRNMAAIAIGVLALTVILIPILSGL